MKEDMLLRLTHILLRGYRFTDGFPSARFLRTTNAGASPCHLSVMGITLDDTGGGPPAFAQAESTRFLPRFSVF